MPQRVQRRFVLRFRTVLPIQLFRFCYRNYIPPRRPRLWSAFPKIQTCINNIIMAFDIKWNNGLSTLLMSWFSG